MTRKTISADVRKALRDARNIIQDAVRMDCNEPETRKRVERVFEKVMDYNALKHLSRERAVRASGLKEHVDFAIQLEPGPDANIEVVVELKRVGVDLALKHVRQAASYAIDYGCEWVLLTNGRQWRLYHVEFGQPPDTRLLEQWDILSDESAALAQKFDLISLKNVRKGGLAKLWLQAKVLRPASLLGALVSEESLKLLRRTFKKTEGVNIAYGDMVAALKRLLNEAAAKELDKVHVHIPERKKLRRKRTAGREELPSEREPVLGEGMRESSEEEE